MPATVRCLSRHLPYRPAAAVPHHTKMAMPVRTTDVTMPGRTMDVPKPGTTISVPMAGRAIEAGATNC